MSRDKNSTGISRRELLFGAVKKLRREDEWQEVREEQKARSKISATLLQEGNALLEQGDYQAAAEKYRACVARESGFLEARRRLGYCLYRLSQFIQARVEFERVLYTNKRDNFCSLYLGLCMARLGKADKAAKAWETYFNPDEIAIQREINIHLALFETDTPPAIEEVADAIEEVVEKRKMELMEDPGA